MQSILFTIYLDLVLPQVSKLSKCVQLEKLDLTIILSLVDTTLHTVDHVLQPAANRVLELQEVKDEMERTIGIKFSTHCRRHKFSESNS